MELASLFFMLSLLSGARAADLGLVRVSEFRGDSSAETRYCAAQNLSWAYRRQTRYGGENLVQTRYSVRGDGAYHIL